MAGFDSLVVLGGAQVLVAPWAGLAMLVPLLAWGWVVSSVLDKHAARFFLGRETWNLVHLIVGAVAVLAVVFMPIAGWAGALVGLLAMVVLLVADVVVFAAVTNKDERVPEGSRLTLDFSKWKQAKEAKKAAKQQGTVTLNLSGPKGLMAAPHKESPEYAVRVAAEQVVIGARQARASRVDLLPVNAQAYGVSNVIDGVRQAGQQMAPAEALKLIDFWKVAAGLDVADRRRKLTGVVKSKTDAESIEIKVVSSGSQAGQKLALVFDPAKAVRRKPEKLGLMEDQLKMVKGWVAEKGGVVLLAGQAGGGRTTTLYSVLKLHDAYTNNVQTLELEIEDALEGIKQSTFDAAKEGADFSVQLRSMLRRDPDAVGVGELMDEATAKEIARADVERSRVYVSMRADSALSAVQTYVKAVGDAGVAAKSLKGAVAQKLVRTLCENCKVPYQPPAELLKQLGLPTDRVKQLHKKGGQVLRGNKPEICPVCQGLGYVGQEGVFEVYPIGAEEQKLIAAQDWTGLRNAWRKLQVPSVSQAALRKAVEGRTSVEEVSRVSGGQQAAAKPAPAKAGA
jgi:general secretion pathway protein E